MNSTDSTSSRTIIFAISVVEAVTIIMLNIIVLALSCKIPFQIKSQLHIFCTFLGSSDLLNGLVLLMLSSTFLLRESDVFQYYFVCLSVMALSSTGITITGYMLLLLTFVKCFSVVCPLRSLRFISRRAAVCSSLSVWVLSFVAIISPTLIWARGSLNMYIPNEECSIIMVYHRNMDRFRQLSYVVSGIFIVGVVVFNVWLLATIVNRNKKIGIQENSGQQQSTKTDVSSNSVPGPSTSKAISFDRRKKLSTTIICKNSWLSTLNGQESANKEIKNKSRRYNLRKSKNFKAYITVLMHVGFYIICGCPTIALASNKNLEYYYLNNRDIRFVCALFLYLTSLINPILTIFRVPVFLNTLNKCKPKYLMKQNGRSVSIDK